MRLNVRDTNRPRQGDSRRVIEQHPSSPFASAGAYVNFLTENESDRVRNACGPNNGRLAEVKRKRAVARPVHE